MRSRPVLALTLAAALACVAQAVESPAPGVVPLGRFVWTLDDPRFGGISAIEVGPDGLSFVAVSDRGAILTGSILRTGDGRIERIETDRIRHLRGRGLDRLPRQRSDAEGLAVAADGTLYVSFEIAPRVLRYDDPFGPATYLPIPRDFNRLRANEALEALAIAEDGTLITLPEGSPRPDGAYPVYRFRDGTWDQPFLLPPLGPHAPVGADFGPDGRLYLLERSFGLAGFATRVRRFTLTGDAIDAGETLIDTPRGTYGNLEGISVWRDAAGHLRLTLVGDNNFHRFLPTEVVEYAVPD
jgi:hypothetical protein